MSVLVSNALQLASQLVALLLETLHLLLQAGHSLLLLLLVSGRLLLLLLLLELFREIGQLLPLSFERLLPLLELVLARLQLGPLCLHVLARLVLLGAQIAHFLLQIVFHLLRQNSGKIRVSWLERRERVLGEDKFLDLILD